MFQAHGIQFFDPVSDIRQFHDPVIDIFIKDVPSYSKLKRSVRQIIAVYILFRIPLDSYFRFLNEFLPLILRQTGFFIVSRDNGLLNCLIKTFSLDIYGKNMLLILFCSPSAAVHHPKKGRFYPCHPVHTEAAAECSFPDCFTCNI